tara:strand:+ start:48 stop:917 length:870 start_codon:yes stop_codon:yes gene_type:complete
MSKDLFVKYITSEKRFSKHTIIAYNNDLEQFIKYIDSCFKIKCNFTEINFQIIRSWIASLLEDGVTSRTVNRKISVLKSFFKFLLREGTIDSNPMLRIINPKSSKKLPVFIEKHEIEFLLDKIEFDDSFVGDRDKLIIELFYVTGIRLSELININVGDIDYNMSTIKVLGKRNKERIIPLSPSIIIQLQDFINKYSISHFLFTNNEGNKVYRKLVYRVVKKYLSKISNVDKKGPHILRHTFATHMLNNGADINAIKELLGHANLSATQIYTHNTIDKLKTVYKQAHPRG